MLFVFDGATTDLNQCIDLSQVHPAAEQTPANIVTRQGGYRLLAKLCGQLFDTISCTVDDEDGLFSPQSACGPPCHLRSPADGASARLTPPAQGLHLPQGLHLAQALQLAPGDDLQALQPGGGDSKPLLMMHHS